MERARNLGLAFITLGFFELAWVLFCVFGGLLLGVVGFVDEEFRMMFALTAGYWVIGLVCLPIGVLHVVAGIQLRQGRGLILAIASLAAGAIGLVLALYCVPVSVPVLIYGFIVLLDPEVRRYLEDPFSGEMKV